MDLRLQPSASFSNLRLLITPREAAGSLAISERTLWKLSKEGEIPCVRIGRSVRYDVAKLKEWIARKQAEGADGLKTPPAPRILEHIQASASANE